MRFLLIGKTAYQSVCKNLNNLIIIKFEYDGLENLKFVCLTNSGENAI